MRRMRIWNRSGSVQPWRWDDLWRLLILQAKSGKALRTFFAFLADKVFLVDLVADGTRMLAMRTGERWWSVKGKIKAARWGD
jgi:hypothetical protein